MRQGSRKERDIEPDEIFLDDRNIPDFDVHRFEGRIEAPIGRRTVIALGAAFLLIGFVMLGRAGHLQVIAGESYREKSENNRLDHQILFSERGRILDRKGVQLAWNIPATEEYGFSLRRYIDGTGFGHLLGYLHYPARDKSGVYYRKDYEAEVGVEATYNDALKGGRGLRIIETDALGNVISSSTIDPPTPGKDLMLSVDARVQEDLYDKIAEIARTEDYLGGAGGIMDIETGEILALVSYPEFDPNVMTDGDDDRAITAYTKDARTPFLNRAISGLYTPGSIVKPMFAIGALVEGTLTPETPIWSGGSISIPNPYFPDKPSIFNDWKAHGWLDMRTAIAQSSNVYFYQVAGGFEGQKGIGIKGLEKYARLFGYGAKTGIDLPGEGEGVIPNPEWKERYFPDDPWRLGDTYFTGIGQYGMQTTLLQALREAAIIASGGKVVTPHVLAGNTASSSMLDIPSSYFRVVREGMRKGVLEGTASTLNLPGVAVAAKTGTAELGVSKTRVNSWVIGFFPYDRPRFAFALLLDRGVRGNTTNASFTMARVLLTMTEETPEYVKARPEE